MSTSTFRLTELPVEILEQVLMHLPGQDIIKMEVISRQFRDLIHDSPTLQYKRELFSAGLIENPRNPCDFAQHRKLYEEHERKWSYPARVVKTIHELPKELLLQQHFISIPGWSLIAYRNIEDGNLSFVHLPPAMSQRPIEWWRIPPLPFSVEVFAVYPPDNLLAVTEEKEQTVWIHFLSLLDGSPYRTPPPSAIVWESPRGVSDVTVQGLSITSSRVMMHVCGWEVVRGDNLRAVMMFVWDWKTGDLVLSLPPIDGSTVVEQNTTATFLDEFRMMLWTEQFSPGDFEFTLFDTLVPRGHPVNSRRFCLPPRYHNWFPYIHVDRDRCLGTLGRDGSITTDPTQAVLVIKLVSYHEPRILLIVRIQTLIEHVRSTGTEACVSWDAWGRDAAVMEVPIRGSARGGPYPLVQGVHVILVEKSPSPSPDGPRLHLCICPFDLSRRSYSALPLWDGDGGTEREVSFEGRQPLSLQRDDGIVERRIGSLGDGKFVYQDTSAGSGGVFHVWELV